jgi:hypothetical protein
MLMKLAALCQADGYPVGHRCPALRARIDFWGGRRMQGKPVINAVLESTKFSVGPAEASIKLNNPCTLVEGGLPLLPGPFGLPATKEQQDLALVPS